MHIDKKPGARPVYLQVTDEIIQAIGTGKLGAGERLPSTRRLAEYMGVNRHTIMRAFAELEAEGWLQGKEKHRFRVAEVHPRTAARNVPVSGKDPVARDWDFQFSVTKWPSNPLPGNVEYAFRSEIGDFSLFPVKELQTAFKEVLKTPKKEVFDYTFSQGYPPLLEAMTAYLKRYRSITGKDICITSGSQEALYLVARALLAPGDVVAMENPGYSPARSVFELCGAKVLGVPIDEQGLEPDALEALAKKNKIRLLYLTPLHQFPTQFMLPMERRKRIYDLARTHDFTIIEDDFDHEFHYDTNPPSPMAAIDPDGRVIYVMTLTKVAFPSMRLGLVVASGNLAKEISALRTMTSGQGNTLIEAAINQWIRAGGFERHMRRIFRNYRLRFMETMKALERGRWVCGWHFYRPKGGMGVLVDPIKPFPDVRAAAREKGILLQSVSQYYIGDGPCKFRNCIRLGFTSQPPERLAAGLDKLALVIRQL